MKKLLLFVVSIFISYQSFAQDPDLFGTWYITEVSTVFSGQMDVSSVNPPIQPTMVFLNTPSSTNVEGNLGCNDYTLDLQYGAGGTSFEVIVYNPQTNFCNPSVEAWENLFLTVLEPPTFWNYIFIQDNGITKLRLSSIIEDDIYLQNVPLAVNDITQNLFSVYPNPVSDQLFITSESATIEKISVYSMSGIRVINGSGNEKSIDVSNLSDGLYFIEISSSEGKSVQKFVKN